MSAFEDKGGVLGCEGIVSKPLGSSYRSGALTALRRRSATGELAFWLSPTGVGRSDRAVPRSRGQLQRRYCYYCSLPPPGKCSCNTRFSAKQRD